MHCPKFLSQEKFGALFSSNLDIFEEDDGVASIDVPVLDFSSETESELDEESPVTLTQEQWISRNSSNLRTPFS